MRRLAGVPAVVPDLGASGTFCFVSEETRDRAERSSPRRYRDATVVYSGIDRGDFAVPRRGARDRVWAWRLLYVGRVAPEKGVDVAVRALAALPGERIMVSASSTIPDVSVRVLRISHDGTDPVRTPVEVEKFLGKILRDCARIVLVGNNFSHVENMIRVLR